MKYTAYCSREFAIYIKFHNLFFLLDARLSVPPTTALKCDQVSEVQPMVVSAVMTHGHLLHVLLQALFPFQLFGMTTEVVIKVVGTSVSLDVPVTM